MTDLTGVRALTLLNPWAHYIAYYGKQVENRTWMPYDSVDRLLIHAGKGWDSSAPQLGGDIGDPHTSAIVAVADLAFACNTSRWTRTLICDCDRQWAMPGCCHWNLANVRPLPKPVVCRGAQRLWTPAPAIVAAVAEQLAQAPA